jgi:hypothetical protein
MDLHEKQKIDHVLAKAIHRNALPSTVFQVIEWHEFFEALRPTYILPGAEAIGGPMMDKEYSIMMSHCFTRIRSWPLFVSQSIGPH